VCASSAVGAAFLLVLFIHFDSHYILTHLNYTQKLVKHKTTRKEKKADSATATTTTPTTHIERKQRMCPPSIHIHSGWFYFTSNFNSQPKPPNSRSAWLLENLANFCTAGENSFSATFKEDFCYLKLLPSSSFHQCNPKRSFIFMSFISISLDFYYIIFSFPW